MNNIGWNDGICMHKHLHRTILTYNSYGPCDNWYFNACYTRSTQSHLNTYKINWRLIWRRRKKRKDKSNGIKAEKKRMRKKKNINQRSFSKSNHHYLNGRFMQLKCLCVHYYSHLGNAYLWRVFFGFFVFCLLYLSFPSKWHDVNKCVVWHWRNKKPKRNKTDNKVGYKTIGFGYWIYQKQPDFESKIDSITEHNNPNRT